MLLATVILVVGKPLYVFNLPQGNITSQVCGGIWVSIVIAKNKSWSYKAEL